MVVQQLMVQNGLRYKLYAELVPEARLRSISVTNIFIVGLVLRVSCSWPLRQNQP
jgi:voltage-gated potassium channel